eukprot:Tbor_TRINITY_DN5484_c3_g5::TRINITY_DN5484_c3_g5_i1::g.25033::m.25033/K20347/TMED2, EMP24; p24 family protein beta-1
MSLHNISTYYILLIALLACTSITTLGSATTEVMKRTINGRNNLQKSLKSSRLPEDYTLNILISSGETRCVYMDARHVHDRMIIAFEDISIEDRCLYTINIIGPDGEVVFTAKQHEHGGDGKIFFEAKQDGEHKVCIISDDIYDKERKSIKVSAAVLSRRKAERPLDPLLKILYSTDIKADHVLSLQTHVGWRIIRHRYTLEGNNTLFAARGLLEGFVLIAMGVGQVMYLKRLFKRKKSVRVA